MILDPIQVALRVAEVLDTMEIRYLVGGSVASSMSGEPRSTLDVDMVVDLGIDDIEPFSRALGDEFHVDSAALARAVKEKSSANLIHFESSVKIDLFVMGGTPLDGQMMERRRKVQVSYDPDRHLYVYTAEDILLQKLRWFRLGEETSERQWRDVLAIVRVQAGALDGEYLARGATVLGVSDLLDRVLRRKND